MAIPDVSDRATNGESHWWNNAVLYQIYIRSFQDSDGDGIGDLEGIRRWLDHLRGPSGALDVDAIWITPFNPSPMADFGYDVSDYTGVHPMFGDLKVFYRLLADCHARGLKLIVDFVPNHCSIEHPWFVESRSSRDNPKRDWFVWRDPAPDGGPPNNWKAMFGGDSWEFDPTTGQYYYHHFLASQPDLNWRNPDVRVAMYDAMRFWLDRGVDGLRVDAVQTLTENEALVDNPPAEGPNIKAKAGSEFASQQHINDIDWPDNIAIVREFHEVVREYPDRLLLGEVYILEHERMVRYYAGGQGFDLCFNFLHANMPWDARAFRHAIETLQTVLPGDARIANVLSSHDESRIATRFGPERVRAAAILLFGLRSMTTIYQGDELGMPDGVIPPDRLQDPFALAGRGLSRDPARTPMQWDFNDAHAGFSTAEPWLPIASNDPGMAVTAQRDDPASNLTLYRDLIAYKQSSEALRDGSQTFLDDVPAGVLGILRDSGNQQAVLFVHMGESRCEITGWNGRIAIASDRNRDGETVTGILSLEPNDAVLIALS
jgi:alpha-glucosidase